MRSILPILAAATVATLGLVPRAAHAQTWPEKPVRFVVAFATGGVHDTIARSIQQHLATGLGQPIVIENRGGAGGNIAAEAVAKAPPDGTAFLVASEAMATNGALYPSLRLDLLKDLQPVAKLADYPVALVARSDLPAASVADLVALARAKPGQLTYGSAGIGTSGHLAAELFGRMAAISLTHVPYKGGSPALADLVGGRLDLMFLSASLTAPQLKQGKVKALAIAGATPAALLPGVAPMGTGAYAGFEAQLFSALFAPAGTPAPIVDRMSAEVGKALADPEVRKRVADLGGVPAASTPAELRRELEERSRRWGALIRERNIRAE
jgi:tripartite-type tricarboxylate transporter receptor subunit TctC